MNAGAPASARPTVLCPIDFSESSRGALRYGAAVASHGAARLTVLAVNDRLLEEADELAGTAHLAEDTRRDVERFLADTFEPRPEGVAEVNVEVTTGKPAEEILRVAGELRCQLIVMSSHGLTGFRKLFFRLDDRAGAARHARARARDPGSRRRPGPGAGCARGRPPRAGAGRPDGSHPAPAADCARPGRGAGRAAPAPARGRARSRHRLGLGEAAQGRGGAALPGRAGPGTGG